MQKKALDLREIVNAVMSDRRPKVPPADHGIVLVGYDCGVPSLPIVTFGDDEDDQAIVI